MKQNTAQNAKKNLAKNLKGLFSNNWQIKLFAMAITLILWGLAHYHKF